MEQQLLDHLSKYGWIGTTGIPLIYLIAKYGTIAYKKYVSEEYVSWKELKVRIDSLARVSEHNCKEIEDIQKNMGSTMQKLENLLSKKAAEDIEFALVKERYITLKETIISNQTELQSKLKEIWDAVDQIRKSLMGRPK